MSQNRKYIIGIGIAILLIGGYSIADNILFDGVRPRAINEDGIQANYFVKAGIKDKAAVILIGGGQWGDYWGQVMAKKDIVGLSLPYLGKEGLPKLPESITLEYFEDAINWLRRQSEVAQNKIIVMGASRNAELALVLASTFPESISGVVAYTPSAVSWANTVLPYNSEDMKPSWTYKGHDIPYLPMEKISGNDSDKIETLGYWKNGLTKTELAEKAAIKVEQINGPILLFSGLDDQVWPSAQMADMIETRLDRNNFNHTFLNIQYKDAGHMISTNPEYADDHRTGTITIQGKVYQRAFGGTADGDFKAKQDARAKLMQFIEKI